MGLTRDLIQLRSAELGFDLCGITTADPPASINAYRQWVGKGFHGTMDYLAHSIDLRANVQSVLPGAQSIIALGMNYAQERPDTPGDVKIARYALGKDYHKVIRKRLKRLATSLAESDPDAHFRGAVDSAPLLERDLAQRAGLGWFGKNTCLINSHRGSFFFIAILLTTARLEPDRPAAGSCGSCRACIDACPTGALVFEDNRWQLDARRCISYLTIEHRGEIDPSLQASLGEWTFGCDICQDVCPFNQPRPHQPLRAAFTSIQEFRAHRARLGLQKAAQLSPEDWDAWSQGSAVRRATHSGFKRNATHNLENQDRTSPPEFG